MNSDRKLRPPPTPALAAIELLFESHLDFLGRKESARLLRIVARRLSAPSGSNIVGIHEAGPETPEEREGREWLRDRLDAWVARHG